MGQGLRGAVMTEPVKYPVICHWCEEYMVDDGDDLVCPNSHEDARVIGALKPQPPINLTGIVCAWDGRRNLAAGRQP